MLNVYFVHIRMWSLADWNTVSAAANHLSSLDMVGHGALGREYKVAYSLHFLNFCRYQIVSATYFTN